MTRSWGRLVLGALLLVVGIGWLLHTSRLIDFPLRALTAVALIVVGIGCLLGSRYGSQSGLVVLGAVLTLALMAGSSASWEVSVDRGFGFNDRVYRPTQRGDLRPFRAGAGQLTIDLTDLQLGLDGGTFDVEARVGAGRILVIVPRGVALRVESSSGVGSIEVFGDRRTSGIGVDDTFRTPDFDRGGTRIALHLRAGVGSIRVVRGSARMELPRPDLFPERPRGPIPPDLPLDDLRRG